jgi:glycosyltransferase involved in cell wall biosynthesis
VISDDCSTDGSVDIIAGYASRDKRIRPIYNNRRLNVSKNRHHAIMASGAPLITTLDSDDFYYSSRKLEDELNLVAHFMAEKQADVCAFSNIVIVDESGKYVCQQWSDEFIMQGELFAGIFSRKCLIPRDFTFSRKLYLKAGGYDPGINLSGYALYSTGRVA